MTQDYFATTRTSGVLDARRRTQAVDWMHTLIGESLRRRFYTSPAVGARLEAVEHAVAAGRMTALSAAIELIVACAL
jgi:LAO/AO transport system kinase